MAADAALFAKGSALARYKGLPPKTTDEIAEAVNFIAFLVPAKPLSAFYPGLADGQRCSALHLNPKTKGQTYDKQTFNRAALRQFTGTENWYRHSLVRSVLYTDGAKYVAESAGAYWLLDEIALAQKGRPAVAAEETHGTTGSHRNSNL